MFSLAILFVLARRAPSREVQARALLERALDALGGVERIEAVDSWDIEGRGRENPSAEIQGLSPDEPTWRSMREPSRSAGTGARRENDESLRYRDRGAAGAARLRVTENDVETKRP